MFRVLLGSPRRRPPDRDDLKPGNEVLRICPQLRMIPGADRQTKARDGVQATQLSDQFLPDP